MLKIFISSTFRDLKDIRKELLKRISISLQAGGMEIFIPDGSNSQDKCIGELKKSEIIIFLISSKYGSLIKNCAIKDCKANCQMKKKNERISYTHCELKVALSEKKPHMTYIIENGWEVIRQLNKIKGRNIDWDKIGKNQFLSNLPTKKIENYYKIRKKIQKFRKEVDKEFYQKIKINDGALEISKLVSLISNHLAENIIKWYRTGIINIKDFSGRKEELFIIYNKLNESFEVYGVGGIGKTTLIQIALLIQKLKGKKIRMLASSQSYLSGSGYQTFKEKCKEDLIIVKTNKITLEEILNVLSIDKDSNLRKLNKQGQIDGIIEKLINEEIILFIDDFNFADENIYHLIKKNATIIVSSRRRVNISRNELCLKGIKSSERENLINIMCLRLGTDINNEIKKSIATITEGHPVSTEILIRNHDKINFRNLKNFKSSIILSNPIHVDEFLKRVVEEILEEQELNLLKNIAVINTNIRNNLDRKTMEKSYKISNFNEIFNNVIDSGMIQKNVRRDGEYDFIYRHIQDILRSDDKNIHQNALNYYNYKLEKFGRNTADNIETFFHDFKVKIEGNNVLDFLNIQNQISPSHNSFTRFFNVLLGIDYNKKDKYLAEIFLARGNLNFNIGKYEASKENYNKAVEIWTELAKIDEALNININMIQNNLANIYERLGFINKAKDIYENAISIRKNYQKIRPNNYLQDLATFQLNLGRIYHDLNILDKSEIIYLDTLQKFEKLSRENPEQFLPEYSKCLHNIGMLYRTLGRFDDSEKYYLKSIEIVEDLYEENPGKYSSDLASSYNSLGNLYFSSEKFDKAEIKYKKSIKLYNSLKDRNPDVFSLYLGSTKSHLGVLYTYTKKFIKAENELLEALTILMIYKEINPPDYIPKIASVKYDLGYLYYNTSKHNKAKIILNEALKIYKKLSKNTPELYLDKTNKIQNILNQLSERK